MSERSTQADLGAPDLKLAGFQLWVQGAIVMVTDIEAFGKECDAMLRRDSSSAVLDPAEPELKVTLEAADRLGHIRVQVDITPDHLAQSHKLQFEVDPSYLPDIIRQCSAIVQEYPVRGHRDRKGV